MRRRQQLLLQQLQLYQQQHAPADRLLAPSHAHLASALSGTLAAPLPPSLSRKLSGGLSGVNPPQQRPRATLAAEPAKPEDEASIAVEAGTTAETPACVTSVGSTTSAPSKAARGAGTMAGSLHPAIAAQYWLQMLACGAQGMLGQGVLSQVVATAHGADDLAAHGRRAGPARGV